MGFFIRRRRKSAFTLAELMVGVGVFAIGMSIAYPLLVSDMNLYIRNFSINKSNNSMRLALQQLKNDIDMAIQPPALMSYRVSNGVGILKPLAASASSAEAILIWVNLGPSYDMAITSGTTTTTTGSINLTRRIDTNANGGVAPVPAVGDRLIIMSPSPYSTGMPETVTMDSATMTKPGRLITSVSIPTSDQTTPTISIKLDQTNPLPTTVPGAQPVFIVREVAYVVSPVLDSKGNTIERQLIRYGTTSAMNNPNLLIRDLDPNPQAVDAVNGISTLTFNYGTGGPGKLDPISVNLPIRAIDYASAIADRNLGGSSVIGSSPSEFNVFLRANPQMDIKARLVE